MPGGRCPFGPFWLALLAVALCGPVCGESQEIGVDVWGSEVTFTCPTGEAPPEPLTLTEDVERGKEFPEGGKKYPCGDRRIFLKVKACRDCVELGLGLLSGLIVADLLLTLGVLCLVYFCCRKRRAPLWGGGDGGGAAARGKPQGQKADRPPPVPNPDYEPIRKGQREVYAGLGGRAF